MKISKQIIALSLATCLTVSPLMVSADNEKEGTEMIPISAEVIYEKWEETVEEYIKYEGKIVELTEGEGSNSILVKDNEESYGQVFHLGESVIIIDAESKGIVEAEALKEGVIVTSFSHKNTPVAQSLPPQSSPNIIVINQGDKTGAINVSKFDEELINVENTLKIIVGEETIIVNEVGEKIGKEDLENRNLIVFYSVATKSIPAQAPAQKIILMDQEKELVEETEEVEELNEIRVLDKIIINEKEISLENELYNKDGVIMIPLRQISEALGYEVRWKEESRTAELTKDAQWTAVTIGEDNYNFAKMLIKLGVAPEIKEGSTFVPFTFLQEVLKVNLDITELGVMNITE